MTILLVIIHIIVSVFLIGVVLLQRGKGADMGASFGSTSSQTVFGSRGPGNFLSKLTTIAAVIFILTSFSLPLLEVVIRVAHQSYLNRQKHLSFLSPLRLMLNRFPRLPRQFLVHL